MKKQESETSQEQLNSFSSNLSRARAQIAFIEGNKISHRCFLDGEFIKMNADKKMEDENGNILNKMDFWLSRCGKNVFDEGWFIIK